jgi:hypothetical protein
VLIFELSRFAQDYLYQEEGRQGSQTGLSGKIFDWSTNNPGSAKRKTGQGGGLAGFKEGKKGGFLSMLSLSKSNGHANLENRKNFLDLLIDIGQLQPTKAAAPKSPRGVIGCQLLNFPVCAG